MRDAAAIELDGVDLGQNGKKGGALWPFPGITRVEIACPCNKLFGLRGKKGYHTEEVNSG